MSRLDNLYSLRKQFEDINRNYQNGSGNFKDLKEIVQKIENEQKLYDQESGFSEAQLRIHDFYIRIPTKGAEKGSIENGEASDVFSSTETIFEAIQPHRGPSIGFNLVGIGEGSTVLLYDIIEKGGGTKLYTKDKAKDTLKDVFSKVPELKRRDLI